MTDPTNDIRMVPLQALQRERALNRKLKNENAVLRALIDQNPSLSSAARVILRASHGDDP